jgi:hypothetical protein
VADLGNDPLIGAFAEFSREVAPMVRVAGVERTREIMRTRKRNHAIALATLAALVVAIPAGAFAALRGDSSGPEPRPADSTAVSPAPSSVPSTVPSAAPSSPSTTAPDGVISKSKLHGATLDLPAWAPDALAEDCPSGPVKFKQGRHFVRDSVSLVISTVVYADVDHDGADETVARFACGDQVTTYQVVAFDRDQNGKIRTLGQVTRQTGEVTNICDLRVGANESVEVQVLDYVQGLGCIEFKESRWVNQQWRSYGWNGSAFVQNGGPRSFPDNRYRTDLAASTSKLAMVQGTDGRYQGTLTVTVRNKGTGTVPYKIVVHAPKGMRPAATAGCTAGDATTSEETICSGPKVAAGATATLTLRYTSTTKVTTEIIPQVWALVDDGYGDPVMDNNTAAIDFSY